MKTNSRLGKFVVFSGLALVVGFAIAQNKGPVLSDDVKAIETKLGGLRALPDDERAVATKDLALQIRKLAQGTTKVQLASGLGNLATEGDFGRDTLQEVTDTLAQALAEVPAPAQNGQPAFPYIQLAQLSRYEHMKVTLKAKDYDAALAKVDANDATRSKADFTLTDLTGKSWTRSDLKGKVVIVNFWATWCPPCRKEMPDLEYLYNKFKDQGFVILAISDEKEETVKEFITKNNYTYPVLLDPGRKVNEAYLMDGIPKSFIYDREGKMVAQTIDMRTRSQFLELLGRAGLK